ncbi:acyltransferase [Alkaliphilus pronyensis]|uniref:Acyltransferase n=1 Tax=Alkaliphilus pronyensis TaxID=1482732 RepID=A0A6I0EYA0_9FIRM|nr:acyltransferase [Alkaliphilus pronyensis]KAB3533453.1 acyltransferase [Alkaliphilus pronyensis]
MNINLNNITRRYDIDLLRVIAIILLMIYHTAIFFTPFAKHILFMKNDISLDWLWNLMSLLNTWRIPLLFFVSGMGVYFSFQRRNWKALLKERAKRILIPFVFGFFAITPIHIMLFQYYYKKAIFYFPSPGHLWFLGNLMIYIIITIPVLVFLKNRKDSWLMLKIRKAVEKNSLLIFFLYIPYVLVARLTPGYVSFTGYAMSGHGFRIGLISFILGFLIISIGDGFWKALSKYKYVCLFLGTCLYVFRVYYLDFASPHWLTAIESISLIFFILGVGYSYLNKDFKYLSVLSKAVLPVYIIHMIVMYIGAIIVLPLYIPATVKFILISFFTIIVCYIIYDLIIKRLKFLHLWFGIRS